MPNEPNSGSSRPRHRRAGDAASPHADKLGPGWIDWPRLARNRTGRPGNGTTRVQRVPPEEWRMADGEWRMANGGKRADDEYGVSLSGCIVSLSGCIAGNGSEPMAQEYPDGPDEEDQEPKKAPNKANLESTQSSSPQKVESGLTGPAGRKRSQSRDDTEIQHREERPAAFRKKHAASATRHYMCHPEESQKILSSSI